MTARPDLAGEIERLMGEATQGEWYAESQCAYGIDFYARSMDDEHPSTWVGDVKNDHDNPPNSGFPTNDEHVANAALIILLRNNAAQLAQAWRDAQRYQWLRNPTLPVSIQINGQMPFSVDAAIDAALSGATDGKE